MHASTPEQVYSRQQPSGLLLANLETLSVVTAGRQSNRWRYASVVVEAIAEADDFAVRYSGDLSG